MTSSTSRTPRKRCRRRQAERSPAARQPAGASMAPLRASCHISFGGRRCGLASRRRGDTSDHPCCAVGCASSEACHTALEPSACVCVRGCGALAVHTTVGVCAAAPEFGVRVCVCVLGAWMVGRG
eukprot:1380141-Prymnesium_polylepis.1